MAEVQLTQRDLDYIARVVDTEVPPSLARTNPAEYERMTQAVFDTVTNRMASDQFPNRAVDVLNQDRQFSKISGPSSLNPYGSVQNAPKASQRAQDVVYDYAASRAQGGPRTAGGAVNYANPNYSSARNLSSWIDPMIEAGAQAFGVGNSTHYHGNAPGMRNVDDYSLLAEGMPSGNIPTPTFRDDIPGQAASATGIMAAIDPPTPMGVEYGGLLGPATSSAPYDMSLFGYEETPFDMGRFGPEPTAPAQSMAAASPAAAQSAPYDMSMFGWDAPTFDTGRFGPDPTQPSSADRTASVASSPSILSEPATFDMGRMGPEPAAPATSFFDYGRFGPELATPSAPFDYGRFGPEIATPAAAAPAAPASPFDMDRFAPSAPVAQGLTELQRSLMDQQLNVGILPNIPAPITTAAIPSVAQPAVTQPQAARTTTYRDPQITVQRATPAQPIGAKASPSSIAAQPAAAQFMGRNNPALKDFGPTGRGLLGGISGAILGGALLGPVGGIIGGLLGKSTFGNPTDYFPSAPDPIPGQTNPGYGYDGLSDYGQQAYNDSPQFAGAVDNNSVGLW